MYMFGFHKKDSELERLKKEYEILVNSALEAHEDIYAAEKKHIEAEKIASKIDNFLNRPKPAP